MDTFVDRMPAAGKVWCVIKTSVDPRAACTRSQHLPQPPLLLFCLPSAQWYRVFVLWVVFLLFSRVLVTGMPSPPVFASPGIAILSGYEVYSILLYCTHPPQQLRAFCQVGLFWTCPLRKDSLVAATRVVRNLAEAIAAVLAGELNQIVFWW